MAVSLKRDAMSCLRLCKNRHEEASFPKKCKPYLKNLGRSCRRKSEQGREGLTQEQWPWRLWRCVPRWAEKRHIVFGQGSSETLGKCQPWRANRLVMLDASEGPCVPLIKGKTQKVYYAEITSPGRQGGLVGFQRRAEGHFIILLTGQEAGGCLPG